MSKRKKALAVGLAALVVVLIPLSQRWQAQWSLANYRKMLIAAGEKLTLEEFAPKPTGATATNTTRFLRAAARIQQFWKYYPSAILMIKPGVARVAWEQPRCLEREDVNKAEMDIWPGLTATLTTNEQSMAETERIIDAGGVEFVEDYSQTSPNYSAYLIPAKTLVGQLTAKAILDLHQGRLPEALQDLKSGGNATMLIARNSTMIAQLVEYACLSVMVGGYWEALQTSGWTDDQLKLMQREWEQASMLLASDRSLAIDRAQGLTAFDKARTSRQFMADMGLADVHNNTEIWHDFLLDSRKGIRELMSSYPRYWGWRLIRSYRDEQRYMEGMQKNIDLMRQAQKGRAILSALKDTQEKDKNPPDFHVVESMIGTAGRFIGLELRNQTTANMVTTAIALERYRLKHRAYPDTLAQLTPDILKSVPVDCMDGHDLRYRLNHDGAYLLYSIGGDGVDNGGDATPDQGKTMTFFNGRDLVWPRPATPQEMQAFEAEQSKLPKTK